MNSNKTFYKENLSTIKNSIKFLDEQINIQKINLNSSIRKLDDEEISNYDPIYGQARNIKCDSNKNCKAPKKNVFMIIHFAIARLNMRNSSKKKTIQITGLL